MRAVTQKLIQNFGLVRVDWGLPVSGVSKTDTEKIIRAHLYQLDDEIPDPVEIKETEARMGKKKGELLRNKNLSSNKNLRNKNLSQI